MALFVNELRDRRPRERAPSPSAPAFGRALPLRDRVIILGGLGVVILLAWVYLLGLGRGMKGMSGGTLPTWTGAYFLAMLLMWIVMMIGMMLPTALPAILIYAGLARKAAREGDPLAPIAFFVIGYVLVWSLFSFGATLAQWGLERASLLSPMMHSSNQILGGILLLAAGLYQLTGVKDSCLRHCQSPVHYISSHWRDGQAGAARMGMVHGLYCLGCCWILMGLLFFGGIMSIWWIGGLTLFVLLEKVMPFGRLAGRIAGVLGAGWGAYLLISELSLV